MRNILQKKFLIRGLEVGERIPFPVLKINFETLGSCENEVEREVFFIRGLEVREIIPFPVCFILFPVLKINCRPLGLNKNIF